MVRLVGLLLAGSLALPASAAPGLPLTDPFGVRFTPAPVRVAPMQGRPLRVLHGRRLGWPRLSPDGRFLAFSRTIAYASYPWNQAFYPEHPVDEVDLLNVRTGRVSTLLTARQLGTPENVITQVEWVGSYRLKVESFNGDDASSIGFFVDVLSRRVVPDETPLELEIHPSRAQARARDRARALFPNLDEALLHKYTWANAFLDDDRSALISPFDARDVTTAGIWFLDFQKRRVRRLVAFKDLNTRLAGAVSVGESTLFLLGLDERVRLFLFQGNGIRPLIELPVAVKAWTSWPLSEPKMSPLLVTPKRTYFLLTIGKPFYGRGPSASEERWIRRVLLYVFDFERGTLQRSNDYPNLYDANTDARGRLIALAYGTNEGTQLVVAELAR